MGIEKVDVCINVYGKPWQTIVTLKSLLAHCGDQIDQIFLIEEKKQPYPFDFELVKKVLNYPKLVHHVPKYYLKIKSLDYKRAVTNYDYWLSIRYQFGFERTDKRYLLLLHNDVVFHKNFLPEYIDHINNGYVGVGELGQCWNCPMALENVCNSDICQLITPSYDDVVSVVVKHPSTRLTENIHLVNRSKPMPLPECRLNEWVALVNAEVYKNEVKNKGVFPFGAYGIMDLGVENYRELVLRGYHFKHFSAKSIYTHAYFSKTDNGHSSLFNKSKYKQEEDLAHDYFRQFFLSEGVVEPSASLYHKIIIMLNFTFSRLRLKFVN